MFRDQIIQDRIKAKWLRINEFLETMNKVIDWEILARIVDSSFESKDESKGKWWRPRYSSKKMLKMYFLSLWYNLSDVNTEEGIYDRNSFREFVWIDLEVDPVPDATTLSLFRNHLNKNGLQEQMMNAINTQLKKQWIILTEWRIVDATIIHAPSSTKNKDRKRDPEMSSTKKWQQYHFWLKVWIATDENWNTTKMTVETAKTHDSQHYESLVEEWDAWSIWDSAYNWKNIEEIAESKWINHSAVQKRKPWQKVLPIAARLRNTLISMPRKVVEFVFWVTKNIWWHRKTKYKWLAKAKAQRCMLLWLCNIYRNRRKLLEYI